MIEILKRPVIAELPKIYRNGHTESKEEIEVCSEEILCVDENGNFTNLPINVLIWQGNGKNAFRKISLAPGEKIVLTIKKACQKA